MSVVKTGNAFCIDQKKTNGLKKMDALEKKNKKNTNIIVLLEAIVKSMKKKNLQSKTNKDIFTNWEIFCFARSVIILPMISIV